MKVKEVFNDIPKEAREVIISDDLLEGEGYLSRTSQSNGKAWHDGPDGWITDFEIPFFNGLYFHRERYFKTKEEATEDFNRMIKYLEKTTAKRLSEFTAKLLQRNSTNPVIKPFLDNGRMEYNRC